MRTPLLRRGGTYCLSNRKQPALFPGRYKNNTGWNLLHMPAPRRGRHLAGKVSAAMATDPVPMATGWGMCAELSPGKIVDFICAFSPHWTVVNKRRPTNVILTLGQCRRHWPNVKTKLNQLRVNICQHAPRKHIGFMTVQHPRRWANFKTSWGLRLALAGGTSYAGVWMTGEGGGKVHL